MAQLLGKTPVTLLIDDQGAGLYLETGELLRRLPEPGPDQDLRAAWIPELRDLLPAAAFSLIADRVHTLVSHGRGALGVSLLIGNLMTSFLVEGSTDIGGTRTTRPSTRQFFRIFFLLSISLSYDQHHQQ